MKKRGVLSLWKTIILVIASLIGVAGVTVLGIWLTGGFDEEKIPPQDFSIETDVDGQGYYNATLNRLEVASNFEMVISTTTEGVTEKEIELKLKGGELKDGYYVNDIIKVPHKVLLNTPFKVELVTKHNDELDADWIVGGITTLYVNATKANIVLEEQELDIAVDVPVDDITLNVADTNQTGAVQQVVVGSTFAIDTTFTPENSKYLYMDKATDGRTKRVFYEVLSANVSYDYDTHKFYAKSRSSSANDLINVYTFANAYYQDYIMSMFAQETDEQLLSSLVLAKFKELEAQGTKTYVSKTIQINVVDVNVDSVEVGLAGNTVEAFVDQYHMIETNATTTGSNLGAVIKDSGGDRLDALMGNLAIKIPQVANESDALNILGGKIIKVVATTDPDTLVTTTTITEEEYDEDFDYWQIRNSDGVVTTYYVMPNTSPANINNAYWLFDAQKEAVFNLKINFFYEKDGKWGSFFNTSEGSTENLEQVVFIRFNTSGNEQPPSWTSNEMISMTISYNEDGTVNPATLDLSTQINELGENVYTTLKYFLFVDEKDAGYAEDIVMTEVFNCLEGKTYRLDYRQNEDNPLKIPGTSDRDKDASGNSLGYVLYELKSSTLTALKGFSGKVKVVAATIKTHANGDLCYDADGNYLIVTIGRPRDVEVVNSLSIHNMTPTFSFDASITPDADGKYYISSKNVNEAGLAKDVINFHLLLEKSEDPDADSAKIRNAFLSGDLSVVCIENGIVSQDNYVVLKSLTEDVKNYNANTVSFKGVFEIQEGFFSAGQNSIDMDGKNISLQLVFDNGIEEKTKDLTLKDAARVIKDFNIYRPQPFSIKAAYEDESAYSPTNPIFVRSESGSTSITWGGTNLNLEGLNDKLTFTISDQIGREISDKLGLYSIRFDEETEDGNTLLGLNTTQTTILSFASTQGQTKTTKLNFYVLSKEDDSYCYAYDSMGNLKYDGDSNPLLLSSAPINFEIVGEGVTEIWKAVDEFEMKEAAGGGYEIDSDNLEYEKNATVGSIEIVKTVTKGDIIDLKSLYHIYTDSHTREVAGGGTQAGLGNTKLYIDQNYYSTYSQENKQNILNMVSFVNFEDITSIDKCVDEIATLKVLSPFNNDTYMKFVIKDFNEGTLFNVSFTLVLRSDLEITPNFAAYYEDNQDYLVQSGNAIGVFAGEIYDLDEYLILTSKKRDITYSWSDPSICMYISVSGAGAYISDQHIIDVDENAGIKVLQGGTQESPDHNPYLLIEDTLNFKSVTMTVYYGQKSALVCSSTFSLYINPNIIAVQHRENSIVDLKEFDSTTVNAERSFATYYEFYRATEYIKQTTSNYPLSNEHKYDLSAYDMTFHFCGEDQYVQIENDKGIYIYSAVAGESTEIDFALGQTINQKFLIGLTKDRTTVYLDSLIVFEKVQTIEGIETTVRNITKCDPHAEVSDETHALFNFNLVYGGTNAFETASALIKQTVGAGLADVKTVLYNGQQKLLFVTGGTYKADNAEFDTNISGNLTCVSTTELLVKDLLTFVSDSNPFTIKTRVSTVSDSTDTLILKLSLDAFISGVGENFVNYDDYKTYEEVITDPAATPDGRELKDLSVLLGDYKVLEAQNIYQQLNAGETYTISHNEDDAIVVGGGIYGFYYSEALLGLKSAQKLKTMTISICEDANGYISGLASVTETAGVWKLTINDLSEDCDSAYIVLKCTLQGYGVEDFSYYYRIKVNPNFKLGRVVYPYAEDAEYLNIDSSYYQQFVVDNNETIYTGYVIDLEESLNYTNSKYSVATRFATPKTLEDEDIENIDSVYDIYKVYIGDEETEILKQNWNEYFTWEVKDSTLKIAPVDKAEKFKIVVGRTIYATAGTPDTNDDLIMVGGQQEYTVLINHGSNYVHSLKLNGVDLNTNTNVYEATIDAGSGLAIFTPDIKIMQENVSTVVDNFGVYIVGTAGRDIGESLNRVYGILKSGTYYYEVSAGIFEEVVFENDVYCMFSETISARVEIDQVLYSIYLAPENTTDSKITSTSDCVKSTEYFFMHSNGSIYLQAKDSVESDNYLEVGFYTDERVVFKINLHVASYWEITRNETYADGKFVGGQTYTYYNGTADAMFSVTTTTTHTIESFEVDLAAETYKNYVKIDNENHTIAFSHLINDTTFDFVAKITDESGNEYTFNFLMYVETSFDLTAERIYDDSAIAVVAGNEIDLESKFDTIKERLGLGGNGEYSLNEGSKKIETQHVGETTSYTARIYIKYTFESVEIFPEFIVVYKYKVTPNVTVEAHYPAPDGENEVEAKTEYVSAKDDSGMVVSSVYENFFGSTALLANETRVVVENVAGRAAADTEDRWTINVASVSGNAYINVIESGVIVKTINNASASKNLISNNEGIPSLNLQFGLTDTSANGNIVFEVIVNEVRVTYSVTITTSNLINIVTNAPNYTNNAETIYAEDLSAYTSKTIFANDRILQYTLKSALVNSAYYLKFEKADGTSQAVEIKAQNLGSLTNFDAGKSLTGYTYSGVYLDPELTRATTSIFADGGEPVVTSRIIPYYYDGTKIAFGVDEGILIGITYDDVNKVWKDGESNQDYTLAISNIDETVNLAIGLKLDEKIESANATYSVKIGIELDVTGVAEDTSSYTTININAGQEYKLLSFSSLGITNTRYGSLFTPTMLQNTAGTIDLQIYGIGAAAGEKELKFHDYFTQTEFEGIVYETGINPRAKANSEENYDFDGGYTKFTDETLNYIRIAEDLTDGKALDYTIRAFGSNNDGNHVMMRLTYSVNIGNAVPVSKSFNILFKVLPNAQVKFKNTADADYTIDATNEVENNRTIATNSVDVYDVLCDREQTIDLWTTPTPSGDESAIIANLYGSTTNLAGGFNFELGGSSVGYSTTVSKVDLGERNYIVTGTNDYGFKLKFYIRTYSSLNPQLTLSKDVLTIGDTIAFGAEYKAVSLPTAGKATYEFTYVSGKTIYISNAGDVVESWKVVASGGSPVQTFEAKSDDSENEDINVSEMNIEALSFDEVGGSGNADKNIAFVTGITGNLMTLELTYKEVTEGKTYTVEYGTASDKQPLELKYDVSDSFESPNFVYKDEDGDTVAAAPSVIGTFSGIDAYAFDSKIIDTSSAAGMNTVLTDKTYVSQIDFYYNGVEIGSLTPSTESLNENTVVLSEGKLVTDYGKTFWYSENTFGLSYGYKDLIDKYTASGLLKIPAMDGLNFGTSDQLANVEMVVTLTKGDASGQMAPIYVTIEKTKTTLFNETVKDGSSLTENTGIVLGNIYNDTIEVVMPAHSSISFAIDSNDIASIEKDAGGSYRLNDPSTGKLAKIITLENNKDYQVTEYVSISGNIQGLTQEWLSNDSAREFDIFVIEKTGEVEMRYNAAAYLGGAVQDIQNMESYQPTLRIEHADEVEDATKKKSETLYFLYESGEKIYRNVQTFSVEPLYEKVTSDSQISVSDYITMTNGTSTYYVLPFGSWAKAVLINDGESSDLLSRESPYKFHYVIDNTTSGGSAFVDENGTITTTETFNIGSHYITLHLYMKVSGANGQFEQSNTDSSLKLGTFTIVLSGAGKSDATKTTVAGDYIYENQLITLREGYTSSVGLGAAQTGDDNKGIYVYSAGQTINFKEMFDSAFISYTNKNYHLTSYTKSGTTTYLSANNLNSYALTEAGNYTCTFAMSYRDGGEITYTRFTATILVYEAAAITEQSISIKTGDVYTLNSNYTWYKVEANNSLTTVQTATEPDVGIFERNFIGVKDGEITRLKLTFYVYENATITEQNVATLSSTTFYLSTLFKPSEDGNIVEIYRIEQEEGTPTGVITPVTSENFAKSPNYSQANEYIIVEKTADGEVKSSTRHRVTFKIIPDSISTATRFVNNTDAASIDVDVDQYLATKHNSFTYEEFEYVDSKMTGKLIATTDGSGTIFEKSFLVTSAGKFYRYKFTFYVYTEDETVYVETSPNVAYNLSELDSFVLSQTGGSGIVTYYEKETLNQVSTINLEENASVEYVVLVGTDYYLYKFYFVVNTVRLETTTSESMLTLSTLNAEVCQKMGINTDNLTETELNEKVKYYALSANTLSEKTTETVTATVGAPQTLECFIMIDDVLHKFSLTINVSE